MSKSTQKQNVCKPDKPRPDFPLFAHATRRWAKKIRGKLHYFGPWDDPQAALEKYLDQKDDLYAGRTPRPKQEGLTVKSLINRFLTFKKHLVDTRELTVRTFDDYRLMAYKVRDAFGVDRLVTDLRADDFERLRVELAKTLKPVALGNAIQRVRSLFKYAYDAELIDRPIRFGPGFKRPSKKTLRKARKENGARMFESADLLQIIHKAKNPLKAMILLGINCGFGNADVGRLPFSALDLERGRVDYPRPKTGIDRRCPLWPETVEALRKAITKRPNPKNPDDAGLVFITKHGGRWSKEAVLPEELTEETKIRVDDPVSKAFKKVLVALKIERRRRGFYALRHTFETIAGDSRDQVAVDFIMGHSPDSGDMSAVYRERVSDERLQAVVDHVHGWLFKGAEQKQGQSQGPDERRGQSQESDSKDETVTGDQPKE